MNVSTQELAKLKPRHADVLKARIDGLYYKVIAYRLNIPIGTVRSRIYYAKKALAKVSIDKR